MERPGWDARCTLAEHTMLDNGHGLSVREVLRQLHVDPTNGLTDAQVIERRTKYGPNGKIPVGIWR